MIEKDILEARSGTGLFAIKSLWLEVLDWIFPPCCYGCGKIDQRWCADCTKRLYDQFDESLSSSFERLEILSAFPHHETPQQAIHALKYGKTPSVGQPLALSMVRCLEMAGWEFDVIIPVPSHDAKIRQRGYNQSMILAQWIGASMNKPILKNILQRHKQTISQVGLNAQERLQNIQDNFILPDATPIKNQNILIVDDVLTTGATLLSCANLLQEAGANKVMAISATKAGL